MNRLVGRSGVVRVCAHDVTYHQWRPGGTRPDSGPSVRSCAGWWCDSAASCGGGRVVEVESVAIRGCARPGVLDFRPTVGVIVGADPATGGVCGLLSLGRVPLLIAVWWCGWWLSSRAGVVGCVRRGVLNLHHEPVCAHDVTYHQWRPGGTRPGSGPSVRSCAGGVVRSPPRRVVVEYGPNHWCARPGVLDVHHTISAAAHAAHYWLLIACGVTRLNGM